MRARRRARWRPAPTQSRGRCHGCRLSRVRPASAPSPLAREDAARGRSNAVAVEAEFRGQFFGLAGLAEAILDADELDRRRAGARERFGHGAAEAADDVVVL